MLDNSLICRSIVRKIRKCNPPLEQVLWTIPRRRWYSPLKSLQSRDEVEASRAARSTTRHGTKWNISSATRYEQ